ncbi:hypothetical protein J7J00_25930 [Bacillus sp. ISL-4]|uniref:hypothetical protein n=1 Tax=Bacillus sp. ISL-4 TaxID=2819125 RepID=UPI001BEC2D4F|nr:hypothetical protein [Bacillus sp. ISL-4]MBT2668842.1 hypothetical protein [Bacillus sp. ISL-4]MBT2673311.1 hypothetical protein [Streptomyces sp. ISL-14]
MKKRNKIVPTFCFAGVLSLSLGFINYNFSNAEAASQSKIVPYVPFNYAPIYKENATIRVSAEDQNMVENSSVPFGFLQQQNGQAVFFEKTRH